MKGAIFHLEPEMYDVLQHKGMTEYLDELVHDLKNLGCTHLFIVDLTKHNRASEWENQDSMIEKIVAKDSKAVYNKYKDNVFIVLENEATLDGKGKDIVMNEFPKDFIIVTAPDVFKVDLVSKYKGKPRVEFRFIDIPVVFQRTALTLAFYEYKIS